MTLMMAITKAFALGEIREGLIGRGTEGLTIPRLKSRWQRLTYAYDPAKLSPILSNRLFWRFVP